MVVVAPASRGYLTRSGRLAVVTMAAEWFLAVGEAAFSVQGVHVRVAYVQHAQGRSSFLLNQRPADQYIRDNVNASNMAESAACVTENCIQADLRIALTVIALSLLPCAGPLPVSAGRLSWGRNQETNEHSDRCNDVPRERKPMRT